VVDVDAIEQVSSVFAFGPFLTVASVLLDERFWEIRRR
jgi:hypothetical protein